MKKIFRLIFGRLFWVALILLIEIAIMVGAIVFGVLYVSTTNSWIVFLVIGLIWLMTVILSLVIINSTANTSYKNLWLATIAILPLIGITLYLFFGNKNATKRMYRKIKPLREAIANIHYPDDALDDLSKKEEDKFVHNISSYLVKESMTHVYKETETTYFPIGDVAFPIMLEELRKAKHYIYIEYFIIGEGKMWNSILSILKEKVSKGVDVRVMYDDVGSIGTLRYSYPKYLESLGIKCVAVNRFKPLVNVKLNNRDHRKILVIDGYVGFTGGINLADEYINHITRFGHWLDNAIMLKGKAVHNLTMLFLSTWSTTYKDKEGINFDEYQYGKYIPENMTFKSDGYVHPYGDLPFDDMPVGETVYLDLIYHAQKTLFITTPYLIIDDQLEQALCGSAIRGVKIKMLVPHIPDKKIVFNITRSYYKRLIDCGVEVYEYTPGFVHEKIFIVDDNIATVGTINLDYRSLCLHMENGVLLYKCSCIKEMTDSFLESVSKSELIDKKRYLEISHHKKILWSLLRLFAPLL